MACPPEEGEAGTATDAFRAPRLDAVGKEVMQLTPPVGGFFRRTRAPMPWQVCWCISIPKPAKTPTSPAREPRMGNALLLKPLYRFSAATSAGTAGSALLRVSASVAVRKDDAPAAVQAAMTNVVGLG